MKLCQFNLSTIFDFFIFFFCIRPGFGKMFILSKIRGNSLDRFLT